MSDLSNVLRRGGAATAADRLRGGRTPDGKGLGPRDGPRPADRLTYRVFKRSFDLVVTLLLMPPLLLAGFLLLILNPWLNVGPLFFVQDRMGQEGRRFRAWKFRSMTEADAISRGAFDALEADRITPLGSLLRRTRIDELPQILNVLRGDMSLIGPRPDFWDHAVIYCEEIPGYRERHAVQPGITGYAQIEVGYVDGPEGVLDKVAADLHYASHASIGFDLWIAWRTMIVVFGWRGS